jgi:hypothetical protein
MRMMRPKNRELQYPTFGDPGVIQKRLDAGRCPKCDTQLKEPTRCGSCNLQLSDQLAPKKSLSFP